jgi:primosomal protein N'
VVQAVQAGDPMPVVRADAARREALGFPPFGGLAEVRGEPVPVAEACAAVAAAGATVLGPIADGTSALVRAGSPGALADALAAPGVDAARARGRLRVDVDPRRI